jgi:chitinase
MKSIRSIFKIVFYVIAIVLSGAGLALSASVTLAWDANDPAPEGYRVFSRESEQSYNYDDPIWEGNDTHCTLPGLTEGKTYYFVGRAYDGDLESADTIELSYTPAAVVANQAPIADAGVNQMVYEAATVTLNGTASSDTDGSITNCQWKQIRGTIVSLTSAASAEASFTAPIVGLGGDTLTFRLTVTDDDGSSSVDTVTVSVLKSVNTDVDGDNVPDVLDLFPDDPNEWADNDGDGSGDNQDIDDDNDGMSDSWETKYGLNPLTNDAGGDADGDGMSNLDEYQAHSNPIEIPGNTLPDTPVIEQAVQTESVGLTPVLVAGVYFDANNDGHAKSHWQISTEPDFTSLILEEFSTTQLTDYSVGAMVLETDTVYYWRVSFIDSRNGTSEWSGTGTFTTVTAEDSGDTDTNGIPDSQEVMKPDSDVNENGIPDNQETGIMCLNTVEGETMVGVEVISENVTLVSVQSITTNNIADQSVQLGFGLIGFRLYLNDGVSSATVKIYFDKQVPKDAKLYKYLVSGGWQVYENAVFAPNRKSVIMILEDGGAGDEDGVVNGVIVDPTGVAYNTTNSDSTSDTTADNTSDTISDSAILTTISPSSDSGGGGGNCFISSGIGVAISPLFSTAAAMVRLLLGAGVVMAVLLRIAAAKS